ncbi:MAG: HDIG domain-containing protein, partial [Acidimicrobiia bacterium]|nr:HDIG domain-containing protein [Acidimicrobiia bacterium]
LFITMGLQDLERISNEQTPIFPVVATAARSLVVAVYDEQDGIQSAQLNTVKNDLINNPRVLPELPASLENTLEVEAAVSKLVARSLQASEFEDVAATNARIEEARAAVPQQIATFQQGETIVLAGELIGSIEAKAIEDVLSRQSQAPEDFAIAGVLFATVALCALYLRRNRPMLWSEPKKVALFGILVVMAALVALSVGTFDDPDTAIAFVFPGVAFGFLAGLLFDTRLALLMALPVSVTMGIVTGSLPVTLYAAASVIAPLPFISDVSSQRTLRTAVAYTSVTMVPVAAALAFLFLDNELVGQAGVFAMLGGVLGGIVGLGVLPFFGNLFGITTMLTLLDLTDRNHPALRLLEEKAPGTFNHSILVGTLASRAARAIGAKPLLAEALAYYHDLGKTEHPNLFIENQFGASNPHRWLPPEESAAHIRAHVTDGVSLAREYRLPPEIIEGIRQHHGTSLMRYFYHKAVQEQGTDVVSTDYRHVGRKPVAKEMAILMMCDSVEAAARAMAYQDSPTADGLRKIVEDVVNEKLEDGQFDDSDLTFGELSRVKDALLEALVSHYHHRITYPNFPGTDTVDAEEL